MNNICLQNQHFLLLSQMFQHLLINFRALIVNLCLYFLYQHRENTTQSRIIGAVRGAHSQLWGTIIPVCSPYAPRKYDRRFGTPPIV